MSAKSWFDYLPLWALFALTVVLVIAAVESGFRLAVYRKRTSATGIEAPISSVIGGNLGLLAFLLAFTFGLAASRFDTRRELLLDETNAIGTAYLRAGMIPEAQSHEIRRCLREYVHIRAEFVNQPQPLPVMIARAEALLDEMWAQALLVARQNGDSEINALFVESLNEVIDMHSKRLIVSQYQIPAIIWLSLYIVSVFSMAGVGYQFGRAGSRDILITLFLAFCFSIVIGLIADLDRGREGTLQVSQQPMIDLDRKLEKSPR